MTFLKWFLFIVFGGGIVYASMNLGATSTPVIAKLTSTIISEELPITWEKRGNVRLPKIILDNSQFIESEAKVKITAQIDWGDGNWKDIGVDILEQGLKTRDGSFPSIQYNLLVYDKTTDEPITPRASRFIIEPIGQPTVGFSFEPQGIARNPDDPFPQRHHSIALVQSVDKVVTGVNNTTLAYASNVIAGNLLVNTHSGFFSGGNTISTPTDTLLHTYSQITAQQNGGEGGVNMQLKSFYTSNSSGGADTVTFDFASAGNGDITCVISEFSGAATSNVLGNTSTNSGTGTAAGSGNVTTTEDGEMLWGAMNYNGDNTTIAEADTIVQEHEGGTSDMPIGTQFQIVSPSGTASSDWTLGASRDWLAHAGAFKPVAAAAAAPPSTMKPIIFQMDD